MDKLKLNLCSLRDPTKQSTWSGTPYNIYSELEKRNHCGKVFSADVPKGIKHALTLLSIPLYGRVDIGRAPLRRYACALITAIKTRLSSSPCTLHTGTLTLPFYRKPKKQHHFLFCDATWDLWSRYATNMDGYSDKMISLFDKLEKRAYQQVEHIFSISRYVKDNLISCYDIPPGKITIVGTGLGIIEPFYGEKDYSACKVLFAAKDRFKDKGGDLVIAAFQKLVKMDPKIHLTIVGGEEAKKYDKHPNINVLGYVTQAELQRLFNEHSLFLMPALNEPWGLVYLEAMACKMPIVGLNRNSFPELSGYGEFGFGIENEDSTELAKIIYDALNNPSRLKAMGEQAQDYCLANFSWEKTVSRIVTVVTGGKCE